jgi:hypothetical protein
VIIPTIAPPHVILLDAIPTFGRKLAATISPIPIPTNKEDVIIMMRKDRSLTFNDPVIGQ